MAGRLRGPRGVPGRRDRLRGARDTPERHRGHAAIAVGLVPPRLRRRPGSCVARRLHAGEDGRGRDGRSGQHEAHEALDRDLAGPEPDRGRPGRKLPETSPGQRSGQTGQAPRERAVHRDRDREAIEVALERCCARTEGAGEAVPRACRLLEREQAVSLEGGGLPLHRVQRAGQPHALPVCRGKGGRSNGGAPGSPEGSGQPGRRGLGIGGHDRDGGPVQRAQEQLEAAPDRCEVEHRGRIGRPDAPPQLARAGGGEAGALDQEALGLSHSLGLRASPRSGRARRPADRGRR